MKRLILSLLALLLLGLCACGAAPEKERSSPAPAAAEEPAAESAAAAELSALLSELRQNVSIATAGSSLRAVSMAARLLDWAETAEISDEQIAGALAPWLADPDDGIPADFREQLSLVDGMIALLTGEDGAQAEAMLADAGCTDCGFPWSDRATALTERLMRLAGLREGAAEN